MSNDNDVHRFAAHGKQVKLNDQHFADAVDEEAARIIADGLNECLEIARSDARVLAPAPPE